MILPYFDSVIEKVAEVGTLRFMMTTNGTTYNNRKVQQLVELNEALDGNVTVIVSLDGSTEQINSILRHPGNYAKTIGFIKNIADAGINFFLNCVIHKHNIDDIPGFMELACEVGASQVNFLSFVPKGYGAELSDYRADPIEVFRKVHSFWQDGDDKIKSMLAGSLSDILEQEACGSCTSIECVGGYRGLFYIVPNGDVYSCPNLNIHELKVGNMMESTFNELIEKVNEKVYKKVNTVAGETRDRFLCKGEKFMPKFSEFLRTRLGNNKKRIKWKKNGKILSWCFSRNF